MSDQEIREAVAEALAVAVAEIAEFAAEHNAQDRCHGPCGIAHRGQCPGSMSRRRRRLWVRALRSGLLR